MAKIYYRKYKDAVESGEMTVDDVIELVPERWKLEVWELFYKDGLMEEQNESF